jgi:hypothetical protein
MELVVADIAPSTDPSPLAATSGKGGAGAAAAVIETDNPPADEIEPNQRRSRRREKQTAPGAKRKSPSVAEPVADDRRSKRPRIPYNRHGT